MTRTVTCWPHLQHTAKPAPRVSAIARRRLDSPFSIPASLRQSDYDDSKISSLKIRLTPSYKERQILNSISSLPKKD